MRALHDRIRSEISTRLAELRPLVDKPNPSSGAAGTPRRPHRTRISAQAAPTAQSSSRAPQRRRQQHANVRLAARIAWLRFAPLRIDAARTSAELTTASSRLGRTLHALLARLVNSGELQNEMLPPAATGYAFAHVQPQYQEAQHLPPATRRRSRTTALELDVVSGSRRLDVRRSIGD